MDSCNIKVAIKARPLNHKEQLNGRIYWKIESDSVIHIDPITEKKNGEQYLFDKVFCEKSTNYDVFDEIVRPIIDRGVQGFNGTVFAYGQTASGKTYTMSGDQSNPGIIPLAINYMFSAMNNSTSREYLLRVSYLEIYNEKVIDLLEKKDNKSHTIKIEIQKDGLHITPLKAIVCQNAQMVIDLMKKGEKNRSIGETNMNERSSRSHTIFRIILESRNVEDDCDGAYQQSVINLVDLAGSERSNQTQSSLERFKEGCKINSSLTTLALVIQQLSECQDSSQYINFRDSKLTRILQTSLGGNSLTAIICTITLAVEDQTNNTLSFASRAKKIKNVAKVNETVTDETLLKLYRVQLSKLNKELEGMKQNQYEHDEVNEIKYKYQEEKRTNEELKERIMRLQKNMITSSVEHKDQSSNKKGYNRRRTWGGKLDNTFSSNSILETIEEDINMPRPSVPSNFGAYNQEFKTPLEPFELDLIRDEDCAIIRESINYDNREDDLSLPPTMSFSVCETPKKVLRERVNNYKNMFEKSMKENNELREFTTLEKQMFYENNEQLKDLDSLRKQVEYLQIEKNESAKLIEKLKNSIQLVENEKRDIDVIMEMQKMKYEKRETDLLATIQETREELISKEVQLNQVISSNTFLAEKLNEIKKLEINIKEMSQLNNTYINDIEKLKLQLLDKDQQFNIELSKYSSLKNEFSLLQNHVAEVKTIPFAIQFLANQEYFCLSKYEIEDLEQLLGHVHKTIENFKQENQNLKDENNNLKLVTNDYINQLKNMSHEINELRSQNNLIEENIKSIVNDFSASSEIDVDNSDINCLINFAVKHFEQTTNDIDKLSNENNNLKDENNSLKLATNEYINQLKNIKSENNELKSQINLIEKNIKSIVNDFSASSEIDVDNSDINSLINFAVKHFEQNTNEIDKLSNENNNLKDENNNLKDVNNNLKLATNDYINQLKNIKSENNELKSQINLIEKNIKSIVNDFSASSEIDVDNSDINSLINFAVKHFEQTTNEIDKLSNENNNLKDENNNLKLATNDYFNQLKNIKSENNELRSQINLIEKNIKSIVNDFSASSEIDVDNSDINSLINFAVKHFELTTNEIGKLLRENLNLKEELSLSNYKLHEVKSFVFDNLDHTLKSIFHLEGYTSTEIEKLKKDLSDTIEENILLKSSIQVLNKLTFECAEIVERVKTNQSNTMYVQEELSICVAVKNEFEVQIEKLNKINANLKVSLENQTKNVNEIQEELNLKAEKLKDALVKLDEIKLVMKDEELKTNSNDITVSKLSIELKTVKLDLDIKSRIIVELEESNLELMTNYNDLKKHYQSKTENLEHKEIIEVQLRDELVTKTNALQNSIDELQGIKTVVELKENEIEKLNSLLGSMKIEFDEKLKLLSEMQNIKLELAEQRKDLEQISQLNNIISELEMKLEERNVSENKIHKELLTKTIELENALLQVNMFQLTVEEMKSKTDSNDIVIKNLNNELINKCKLIEEFENCKPEVTISTYSKEILILNEMIIKLKSELKENSSKEVMLKNELLTITVELEDAFGKINEVKSVMGILNEQYNSNMYVIEQLRNEIECGKSALSEKLNLITELEDTNLELLAKCKNSDVIDQLNKIIVELETKLEDKAKNENEILNKLQANTILLEDALAKENEVQTLVESMENEIKSNIVSTEQLTFELATKSNLLIAFEEKNSELLLKCSELNDTMNTNMEQYERYVKSLQEQLQTLTLEKTSIKSDLNLINQKFLDMTKYHDKTQKQLEDKLHLQVLNYHNLYKEFCSLSSDIESLFSLQIVTESNLREEIQLKSTEIDELQKQTHESILQNDYDKLEEEYILRCRECDEALDKITNLESILLSKVESENKLKNDLKSKCIALEEYKKNVEFLFSRNDSFQVRVNDFEDNVLVDLNEEFDSMKSELLKKTEYENTLIKEKEQLESNMNKLQEKLLNTTKELELSEERSEDLASIINVLVIEVKDANSIKENLESRLNEAEHELLKFSDLNKNLEHELYIMQREFENTFLKAEGLEKELFTLKSKVNDKMFENDLDGCDINQLIDPFVDHVHDIKLKLTELNSAMISGNKSEKRLRMKIITAGNDVSPLDENCDFRPESPGIETDSEIDRLQKSLEDKLELINMLQKNKTDVEKYIVELQDQIKNLSDANNHIVNDLKEKTLSLSNLNDELNNVKKQYTELEELNQATKTQIHYSFDIDSELRSGKKNIVNEINLLEPGKITGVLTHHNLSNLLDTFVNLIMIKEQQIVTNLMNDHNKIKQQYEDQIKQFQEDIKKEKEWQEQVESDNEKLCVELENLKSQKYNYPSRENMIKELTEKLLEAENNSFNYLSELQELKTQISKTSEENYQALSNEFEVFKTSSEQSIQDLKTKLEDLTKNYNESLSMYNDQKNSRSTIEGQIEKIKYECTCLKAIIEKKDEDIKNLLEKVNLKTQEYEKLIEKNGLLKDEMKNIHEKKIDELQLELNDKTQKMYCTEKLLKEVTKNYNQLVEENSLNLMKIKYDNDNSAVHVKVAELERDILTVQSMNKDIIENLEMELNIKNTKIEESEAQCSKLIHELEVNKLKIIAFEKQLESCYQTLKLKDDLIENYRIKSKTNEDNLVEVNNITEKLRQILKCSGTLTLIYENISSLMTKCESFEEEIEELKRINMNLDNECDMMCNEIKSKDSKLVEFLTSEDELKQNIESLTEERNFLKNKCEQFKNVNHDVKKLNEEISGYMQNIYELRKEKGQLIVQHEKELKQLKIQLKEVHSKNLELLNDHNKVSEAAKNLEKTLKEDIQQLNRCIVDKNAKISTLELFSKNNTDELKKKNHELEHVFKKARDENHMLRKEIRRLKDIASVRKVEQCTQTIEEQSVVSSAMMANHKSMTEKITKLESDNQLMKKMLHHRKIKIEELQKQLEDKNR